MGLDVTLPLGGTATVIRGFEATRPGCVYRLRSLGTAATVVPSVDMFVTRDMASLAEAAEAGFQAAIFIGNEVVSASVLPSSIRHMITLPSKFDYLANGDVVGIRTGSRNFRALYRRNSRHNSFLVTDRCNHYCLMCSQPPKDVDDRWLLDEIRMSIPLIDPDTHSLAFTGGEPLLDWQEFINVLGVCRDHLPRTAIHVLSNGRAFADSRSH